MRTNGSPKPKFETDEQRLSFLVRLPLRLAPVAETPQVTAQVTPQVDYDHIHLQDRELQDLMRVLAITSKQVTPQVTGQVGKLLKAAVTEAKSREALQSAAGLVDREHFRKAYLEPLVSGGWLVRTIPNKPTSPLQRYRLTEAGRVWLAASERTRP